MPIRVTIELTPNGDESRKSTMATMDIENVRMYPDDDTADYSYAVQMKGNLYTGTVHHFYRPNGFLAVVGAVIDANWMYAQPTTPRPDEVK